MSTNISKLIIGKSINLTKNNTHSLGWFIRLKVVTLNPKMDTLVMILRMYKYYQKGNENIHYEFRQYDGSWGSLSLFIEVEDEESIFGDSYRCIVNSYTKTSDDRTVPFVIREDLESFLITHEKLNEDGEIFQLYLSGSELDIDIENYKEIKL